MAKKNDLAVERAFKRAFDTEHERMTLDPNDKDSECFYCVRCQLSMCNHGDNIKDLLKTPCRPKELLGMTRRTRARAKVFPWKGVLEAYRLTKKEIRDRAKEL